MVRRLAAIALLVALALPSGVLAADPTTVAPAPPTRGGAWAIVAIETPGGSIKVDGKLAIGTDLAASVGCNSMSAPVTSFDGTRLVIGPLATTEIGCPPDLAAAESYLAAVLGAGSLAFDGTALTSSGGRIDVAATLPDEPAATPPPADPNVDPATCAALLGPEWSLASDGTVSGSEGGGSTGGSTGTSGSGSSSSGSGGSNPGAGGVAEPPGAIESAVPVGQPMPPVPDPSPGATTPTPAPEATVTPVPAPDTTATPVPAPHATPMPALTTTDAPPPDPVPAPGASGQPAPSDVPVGTTIPIDTVPGPITSPGGSISRLDACRALLAALRSGKTGAIPPGTASEGGMPVAAQDLEHDAAMAASTASPETAALVVAGLVGAIALLAGVLTLRGRRRSGVGDAEGEERPAGAR